MSPHPGEPHVPEGAGLHVWGGLPHPKPVRYHNRICESSLSRCRPTPDAPDALQRHTHRGLSRRRNPPKRLPTPPRWTCFRPAGGRHTHTGDPPGVWTDEQSPPTTSETGGTPPHSRRRATRLPEWGAFHRNGLTRILPFLVSSEGNSDQWSSEYLPNGYYDLETLIRLQSIGRGNAPHQSHADTQEHKNTQKPKHLK